MQFSSQAPAISWKHASMVNLVMILTKILFVVIVSFLGKITIASILGNESIIFRELLLVRN